MDNKKKILLLSAAICYALTICGFIISSPWLTLLFFVIHSILLLCFSYSIWRSSQTPHETKKEKTAPDSFDQFKLALEQQGTLKKEKSLLSESPAATEKSCEDSAAPEYDTAYTSPKAEYDFLLPPASSDNAETINIIQTAKAVIEELNPFTQEAGIRVQISAAEEAIHVKADENRIRILFRNIIDNSIKYMNRAGNLVITMSILGDDIFIILKDDGNGLDESETPHIFDLNYQGSNRISGNGLGLTQAKAIVNSYGGTIYAKSTANNGMGIYIQMPIK